MNSTKGLAGFWYPAAAVVILAIATAYRFTGLDRQSLWADELWGVMACSKGSWMAMVRNLVFHDNHPPGYQTILYFVMKWVGKTDFIIRLPSAIAGVLGVLATLLAGKNIFGKRVGIIAALMVAGSYQAIYYSQEARAYSMLMLSCLASTYFFIRLFIYNKNDNKNIFMFSMASAVCSYLHYAGLVFVLCEAVLFLIIYIYSSNRQNISNSALYGFGIPLILYFKWIPVLYHHMTGIKNYWAGKPDIYTPYETYSFILGPNKWIFVLEMIALIYALFIISRAFKSRLWDRKSASMAVLFFLCVAPVTIFFIKSISSQSIYTHRHFIFIIPFVSIIFANAIDKALSIEKNKRIQFFVCLVLLLIISATNYHSNKEIYTKLDKQDFRGAANIVSGDDDFLKKFSQKRSLIIASHEFFYHYLWINGINATASNSLSFYSDQEKYILSITDHIPESVYFLEVSSTSSPKIRDIFEKLYQQSSEKNLVGINVIKYSIPRLGKPLLREKITAL